MFYKPWDSTRVCCVFSKFSMCRFFWGGKKDMKFPQAAQKNPCLDVPCRVLIRATWGQPMAWRFWSKLYTFTFFAGCVFVGDQVHLMNFKETCCLFRQHGSCWNWRRSTTPSRSGLAFLENSWKFNELFAGECWSLKWFSYPWSEEWGFENEMFQAEFGINFSLSR